MIKKYSAAPAVASIRRMILDLIVALSLAVLAKWGRGWAGLQSLSKQTPKSITINFLIGVVSKFAESKLTVARQDVTGPLMLLPLMKNVSFGLYAQIESLEIGIYEIQILQDFYDRTRVVNQPRVPELTDIVALQQKSNASTI